MADIQSGITFVNILTIFGAGLTSAVINILYGNYKDGNSKKKEATYLSLRIAVQLENFAITCANQISDFDDFQSSDGNIGSETFLIPELLDYPESIEGWKSLNTELSSALLMFPRERNIATSAIGFILNVAEIEDGQEEWMKQSKKLLKTAITLASELRTSHKIPPFKIDDRYPTLKNIIEEVEI